MHQAVQLLNSVINLLPVGIALEAEDGTTLLANEMATLLSEYATSDFRAPASIGTKDQDNSGRSSATTMEEKTFGPSGERTLLQYRSQIRIFDQAFFLTTSLDFTDRKRLEAELLNRAYFDSLTGLPNGGLCSNMSKI